MAFTTWAALRSDILDKIADYVAGSPMTGEYEIGDRKMKYRSIDELTKLYNDTKILEAAETSGNRSTRVSYGRPRRFR